MESGNLASALVAGWCGMGGVLASEYFRFWLEGHETSDALHKLINFALAVAVFLAWLAVPYLLAQVGPFRRAVFPFSRLEGYWLQSVSLQERPWSVSRIHKDSFFGWTYLGMAYGADGRLKAGWRSSDLKFDAAQQCWIFKGKSERYKENRHTFGEGNVLSVLYFDRYIEESRNHAHARLPGRLADLDLNETPTASDLTMVRIGADDWRAASVERPSIDLDPAQVEALVQRLKPRIDPA